MRVRCIRNEMDDKFAKSVGFKGTYPLYGSEFTVGKEYDVLAFFYYPASTAYVGFPCFEIENDIGRLDFVPVFLFEVTENTVSKYWKFQFNDEDNESSVSFRPKAFEKKYFHDDLSEGFQEEIDEFRAVCALIKEENDAR